MGATQSKAASDGVDGLPGKDGVGIDSADYSEKLNEITFKKTDGTKLGPFMIKGLNGVSLDTAVMSGGELVFTKTDGTKLGPFKVKGADGLSIKNIKYDELSGKITFIMTDDTTVGPYMVRGAAGKDGINGVNGKDGINGVNGKDGVSNVAGPTGGTGPRGPGIAKINFTPEGLMSFESTDPTLPYSSFNVRGPRGTEGPAGPPGKDATIVTSNGIQYPGIPGDFAGYATDKFGNIFAPTDGPIRPNHNWNVSGKDGVVAQFYTDGTKRTVFSGPIAATEGITGKSFSATEGISGKSFAATGNITAAGDITAGGELKIGDDRIVNTDWIRVLNNTGSFAKGFAAKQFWADDKLQIKGRDILAEIDGIKADSKGDITGKSFAATGDITGKSFAATEGITGKSLIVDKSQTLGDTFANRFILGDGDSITNFHIDKEWVRLLSNPNDITTFNKGLAAKNLYSDGAVYGKSLKLGPTFFSPGSDNYVRLLSDPDEKKGSYNQGLAAQKMWVQNELTAQNIYSSNDTKTRVLYINGQPVRRRDDGTLFTNDSNWPKDLR